MKSQEAEVTIGQVLNGVLGLVLIFASGAVAARAGAFGPLPVEKVEVPVIRYEKPPTPDLAELVREAAEKHGLRPEFLAAVIDQENPSWNPRAINPNAHLTKNVKPSKAPQLFDWGLLQVHGRTALGYGVKELTELLDPQVGIDIGAKYLADCKRTAEGMAKRPGVIRRLAFACYHRGQGKMTDSRGLKYAANAERHYQKRLL